MVFENINFYPASVNKGQTLKQFTERAKHLGLSDNKLKEAYELAKKVYAPGKVVKKP